MARHAIVLVALAAAACGNGDRTPPVVQSPCVAGSQAPTAEFEAFVAGRPAPPAFRERWPGVTLVLPGQPATRELRQDCSRYIAATDGQGRIVGGRFM